MPIVFIVVMSFVAYAVGAVAIRRVLASRPPAVCPVEALLAAAALVGIALLRRPPYRVTYCVICAAVMLLVGASIARATMSGKKRVLGGTREFEDGDLPVRPDSPWRRWLRFSRAVVDYEFRLLLLACYLLLIGPIAVASCFLRAEPPSSSAASTWMPKSETPTLDAARRPF